MTKVKEQAIELIRNIPDDKVAYVIEILRGIKGLSATDSIDERRSALEGLEKYRGSITSNINEKQELLESRDERYASFN